MKRVPVEERFWRYVERGLPSDQCWTWNGAKSKAGYGQITGYQDGKAVRFYAHRLILAMQGSPAPKGMDVDHLCRNRACVNPAHLECVTHQQNMARGVGGRVRQQLAKLITHCPQGHPYSPENTYRRPSGARRCRECELDYHRRKKAGEQHAQN